MPTLPYRREGNVQRYPIPASTSIEKHSLLEYNPTTGEVRPAANTSGSAFAGVAAEAVTSVGATTPVSVLVYKTGVFSFSFTDVSFAAQGHTVYAAAADRLQASGVYPVGRVFVASPSDETATIKIDGAC